MERDELALKCRHQQKQLRKHVGGVPGGEPRGQTIGEFLCESNVAGLNFMTVFRSICDCFPQNRKRSVW